MKRRPPIPPALSEASCEGHRDRWRARLSVLRRQDKWTTAEIRKARDRLGSLERDAEQIASRIGRAMARLGIGGNGHPAGCQCRPCIRDRNEQRAELIAQRKADQ